MKIVAYLYLLPVALLMGCEANPRPQDVQAIVRLTRQADSLSRQAKTQHDSLAMLREDLATAAALVAEQEAQRNPAKPSAAQAVPTTGVLYHTPEVTRLPDAEMAEVLSLADSTVSIDADNYKVVAYRVCNGPPDNTLEYCNCSHYVYLATCTYDLPADYQLYRIGPFFMPQLTSTKGTKEQPLLAVQHEIRGRKRTDVFRISAEGVRLQ